MLHILSGIFLTDLTSLMNLNSCGISRSNIKSFFNRRCLWLSCRCCLNYVLLLGQRASDCTFGHLFVPLPSLCLGACSLCAYSSTHFSAVHSSVVIICAGNIPVLFKLILKFRYVLKHSESLSSLLVIKTSKKTSPQGFSLF